MQIQTQPAFSANQLTNWTLPAESEIYSHSVYQPCSSWKDFLSDHPSFPSHKYITLHLVIWWCEYVEYVEYGVPAKRLNKIFINLWSADFVPKKMVFGLAECTQIWCEPMYSLTSFNGWAVRQWDFTMFYATTWVGGLQFRIGRK